jgi:hypothetical protein
MSFVSPGRLFKEKQKTITNLEDVLAYAEFLRTAAGLGDNLPVDLDRIFAHFEIPTPKTAPLPDLQGLLLDSQRGIIIINSNDPERRQKFTRAHELVEMLFKELSPGKELGNGWELKRPGGFKEHTKEYLCNRTAANLLIPTVYVQQQISQLGVNFDCARSIADACEVSLSAALVQMAQQSSDGHFVVMWRMKNKPADIKNQPDTSQLTMFGMQNTLPAKKLRVEWCLGGDKSLGIPKDKSTDHSSCIHQAWETNSFTTGTANIALNGRSSTWYSSENMPFIMNDERHVISLMKKN